MSTGIIKTDRVVGCSHPLLFWNLNYFSEAFLSAHNVAGALEARKMRGRPKGSKNKAKVKTQNGRENGASDR